MTSENPFAIRSPYDEIKQRRQQRLLVAISWATGAFAVPGAILSVLFINSHSVWQTWLVLGLVVSILPLSLVANRLAHQNRQPLAMGILFSPLVLILCSVGLLIEGFFPILVPTLMIVVMMVVMLLDARWGYVTAVLAGLLWLVARSLMEAGIVTAVSTNPILVSIGITLIVCLALVFIAVLNQVARYDLQEALNEATSELVQANRKLAEASRLKSQFTAHTSHELRSPLNAIITFTDLTMRGAYGPLSERQREKLTRVLHSARRLLGLIDDLLDLSKIEAGEITIEQAPLAVGRLIEVVHATMEAEAEAKGLQLATQVSPAMPPEILGDEKRLQQVLLNLVQNAVKFTQTGNVVVSIEPIEAKTWRMRVQDTGPGIPEREFDKIFQEFARVGESGSRTPGVGLGLAITNRLVLMMEGEIELQSRLGQGSTFTVVLPLKRPLHPHNPTPAHNSASNPGKKLHPSSPHLSS